MADNENSMNGGEMPQVRPVLPNHIMDSIDGFRGRTWLLPRILDWYDKSDKNLMLLVGKPGTGKSMISAWLAGHGPAPDEAQDKANLERLRGFVAGAHFCQVNSDQNMPKSMAEQMARQLTRQVKGFGDGIAATLGSRVDIRAVLDIGTMGSGTLAAAVYIHSLDLGKYLGPPGIEQALILPLRYAYNNGFTDKILLIVDSMDEAQLYKGDYKIIDVVQELVKMDKRVRILATSRDEPDVLAYFRDYPMVDLVLDAPAGVDDVGDYVDYRLKGVPGANIEALGQRIKGNARGNYLFAHLVVEDLIGRLNVCWFSVTWNFGGTDLYTGPRLRMAA